jgi:hypothetical protein
MLCPGFSSQIAPDDAVSCVIPTTPLSTWRQTRIKRGGIGISDIGIEAR